MSDKLQVVVLTSAEKRHNFFVHFLAKYMDILGVVREEKGENKSANTVQENKIIEQHFRERDEAEEHYFGHDQVLRIPDGRQLTLPSGSINSPQVYEWVTSKNPDFIILFGTGIVKDPILSAFENRVVNMHLGLSPYYRGSGTNFWPLVDGLPECIGATIHLATLKVDGGPILLQVRPEVVPTDLNHDMGCKTIIAGAQGMADAIQALATGRVRGTLQPLNIGKVYKKRDFTAEVVLRMKENLTKGMIKNYVIDKENRDAQFPIVIL